MRLRTIGGLWIDGGAEQPVLGPRRLGLLVLVAAAGKGGISRDRILGILWPEAEQEQARHTLSQTLYSLKRETGREWIVGTSDLRLDPDISSDVGEIQDALAAGDHLTVATLYTGVFLNGFYLPGGPEFERWVEDERARLHAAAVRAVERLATGADQGKQHSEAIRWWNRLTELDPLSARFAAGRMRALVAAGDRASALAHARTHEGVVRRELDTELDPTIRQLVSSLKSSSSAPAVIPPVIRTSPGAPPAAPVSDSQDVPRPEAAPLPVHANRRGGRRVVAVAAGAALLVALGASLIRPARVPVAPFLAVGVIRSPEPGDSTSLGSVLRDMLATSLGGVPGIQVVANSRLVELMPRAGDTVPGATTDAARRAGATEVIEGEVRSEAGGLVLTFRRVALDRGVVRRGYVVRAANRYALADSATAAIARDLHLTPPSITVSDIRTSSPGAYALYEEGLRAYYGYDGPAAYRLMTAALQRDSSFAMAAYYAWQLSRSLDAANTDRAIQRAKRLAPRTIERERLLIQGSIAALEAPLPQAAAIAETLTVRYPSDPDGQLLLGQVRHEQGDWAGAVAAYERAFAIDSLAGATSGGYCRVCLALGLMSHTYLRWDSAQAAERSARRLLPLRPDDPPAWNNLVEPLLRQGRRAEAEFALDRGSRLSPSPGWSGPLLYRDLIRWGKLEEADRQLFTDLSNPSLDIRSEARWLSVLSLRDQGRLREAMALAGEQRIPQSRLTVAGMGPDPLSLALIAFEGEDQTRAARMFSALAAQEAASAHPPGFKARILSWLLTLAATADAEAGDTATVRRLADSVQIVSRGSISGRDPLLHHFLRGLLFQRSGRHAEAVESFQRAMYSRTDGYTRINLEMSRSLLELQRPDEAIAVLRPAIRGGVDGSNSYQSRTELHEALALAFAAAGKRDSALTHYRAVEQAWRHADPQFEDRYRRAKAAVESIP